MRLEKLNSRLEIPCYHCGKALAGHKAQLTDGIAIVNLCLCAQCVCLDETELLERVLKRR